MPFEVMCDASDLAIGAVLGQRENGKPHVVYYARKTLNEAQRNYTTTEKELLAVVYSLDKFRAYLVGSDIVHYMALCLKCGFWTKNWSFVHYMTKAMFGYTLIHHFSFLFFFSSKLHFTFISSSFHLIYTLALTLLIYDP